MSADQLRDLYVTQGRSQKDIAESHGVSQALVYLRMLEYGIKSREDVRRTVSLDRENLKQLFIVERWSISKIAAHLSCSKRTVQTNLNKYDLGVTAFEHSSRTAESNKSRTRDFIHDSRGYVLVRKLDHPYGSNGYIAAHRIVAEDAIGRVLDPRRELVHHINLRKRDNWIENLAVLSPGQHTHVHKSMERALAYLCGIVDIRPKPVDFRGPVFWGGKYITSIDFVAMAQERFQAGAQQSGPSAIARLTQSIRENGLKYEFEDAA